MRKPLFVIPISILFFCCNTNQSVKSASGSAGGDMTVAQYFNYGDTGVQSGGIRMIPVKTPAGEFKVWTKRFGNNPKIKILLLHGGPAATHQYMECFESFFPKEGFEFYEYDQLGCGNSYKPTDTSLWVLDRFVEEV